MAQVAIAKRYSVNKPLPKTEQAIVPKTQNKKSKKIRTVVYTNKNKEKSTKTKQIIMLGISACILILFMLLNYAIQYEYSYNIVKGEKKLAAITNEFEKTQKDIDSAIKNAELTKYSTDVLGFVPKEQLLSRVISTDHSDYITVSTDNKKDGGFGMMLSSLYDTIRNIFE